MPLQELDECAVVGGSMGAGKFLQGVPFHDKGPSTWEILNKMKYEYLCCSMEKVKELLLLLFSLYSLLHFSCNLTTVPVPTAYFHPSSPTLSVPMVITHMALLQCLFCFFSPHFLI